LLVGYPNSKQEVVARSRANKRGAEKGSYGNEWVVIWNVKAKLVVYRVDDNLEGCKIGSTRSICLGGNWRPLYRPRSLRNPRWLP
jgi:hypothetical protein